MKKALSVVCILLALLLTLISCGESHANYKDEDDDTVICPYCDEENDEGDKYCSDCGKSLSKVIVCSACKTENSYKKKYCKECGASLSGEVTDAEDEDAPSTGGGSGSSADSGKTDSSAAEDSALLLTERLIYANGTLDMGEEYVYDADGNLSCKNVYYYNKTRGRMEPLTTSLYTPSGEANVLQYTHISYKYNTSKAQIEEEKRETLYDVYDAAGRKLYTSPLSPATLQSMTDVYSSVQLTTENMYNFHAKLGADSCTVSEHTLTNGEYVAIYKLYKGSTMIGCEYEYYTADSKCKVDSLYVYDGTNIVAEYVYDNKLESFLLRFEYKYSEDGRATVRTQYVGQNDPSMIVEPANHRFLWPGYSAEVSVKLTVYNDIYINMYTTKSNYVPPASPIPAFGGNFAYNSSDSSGDPIPCGYCEKQSGYHECIYCGGEGQTFAYFDINGKKVYHTCNRCSGGIQKCIVCGGDGYVRN